MCFTNTGRKKSANVCGKKKEGTEKNGVETLHTLAKNLKMQINVSWPFSF